MASKLLIVALISTVAIILSLYNIITISESANTQETTENPFARYSINTKCEMLNLYHSIANNSNSLEYANKQFIGYTSEDIGKILEDANKKFYEDNHVNSDSILRPNVDQGAYQQYINDISLDLFVEKTIKTNDINPKIELEIRELFQLLSSRDIESIASEFHDCGIQG